MVAEQMELLAREQRFVLEEQGSARPLVPGISLLGQREQDRPSRNAVGKLEHERIVGIQHPHALVHRVPEQQPLVRVIRVHRWVPVEMVRSEVREHADVWREVRTVVQLKG